MPQPLGRPVVVEARQVDVVAEVAEVMVGAFFHDPLWSWAFPDPLRRREQHRQLWRLCVEGAVRYRSVWLSAGHEAAAVWIPPGGTELSSEQEARFEPLVTDIAGPEAQRVFDAFALLENEHPHDEPHYYLSMLGTDPRHLGHGHGLGLLADNLTAIDAAGRPAYLEASNPANVALYERYGFEVVTTCAIPGGPEVTTMWRPAQQSAVPDRPE
jgi:ribosomal protein S18 acetylase RimI-like enzyme